MFSLIIILLIRNVIAKNIYLHDFGIITNISSLKVAKLNGKVFYNCIRDANVHDNVILLNNETIYYLPVYEYLNDIHNINIVINGTLILYNDTDAWPLYNSKYYNSIDIRYSSNITITGSGIIDGQGYIWWKKFLIGTIPRKRPTIIYFENSKNININTITLFNSPRFNIYINNGLNFIAKYLTIKSELLNTDLTMFFKNYKVPVFPFNTDGIDFSGVNAHIYNITVSNYDDSIAIKPNNIYSLSIDNVDMTCTANILVENITLITSVGLSIGSVSEKNYACVKNVVFKNIVTKSPIKLIYIKTASHPSDNGVYGKIDNITYDNIYAYNSILWPIYIGPQQQKEPDGTGDGFWPNTNPFINISNIFIKNIKVDYVETQHSGILRCNISNPCKNITFYNVKIKYYKNYYCDYTNTIEGTYDNSCIPRPLNCGLKYLN